MNATRKQMSARADHRVIAPSRRLAVKASMPGVKRIDFQKLVQRTQCALDELSEEFEGWMHEKVEVLLHAREAIRRLGMTAESIEDLLNSANELKGQSQMLGYRSAGLIAGSLCRLIEVCPETSQIPLNLIDHHVDGVRVLLLENAEAAAEDQAKGLVEELRSATERFLKIQRENGAT